jgi:AN1-type zinc finger protein 5/6
MVNIEDSSMVNIDINNCYKCNKDISLIKFKCKCDKYFCIKHRYSDIHNCNYDYKTNNKKKLSEENPVIKKMKIENI